MSLCCGLSITNLSCCESLLDSIGKATLRVSKEVQSGGKQIKMIQKQYNITEVSFSGEIWFDILGRLVYIFTEKKELFKYKIVYEGDLCREFTWCFN